MIRRTMKMMLVALVAIFTLGSMAEAAPKKVVKHRARHSTRVSASTTPPPTSARTAKKKTAVSKHRVTSASRPAATAKRPTTTKRRPATKPR